MRKHRRHLGRFFLCAGIFLLVVTVCPFKVVVVSTAVVLIIIGARVLVC